MASDDRPIVLIDLDGVCADLHGAVADRFNRLYGTHVQPTDFSNYSPSEGLEVPGLTRDEIRPRVKEILSSQFFYSTLAPIPGAKDGLRQILDGGFRPIILSSFGDAPGCVQDKCLWLDREFPFLDKYDRIFTGKKSLVRGTIFIDDSTKHLLEWKKLNPSGYTCTFELPYTNPSGVDVLARDWLALAWWLKENALGPTVHPFA